MVPAKPKFKSSDVFKHKLQCKKMKKLGKIEASHGHEGARENIHVQEFMIQTSPNQSPKNQNN